jgi:O-antigen ligase
MPPKLALLFGVIFIYFAYRSDRKRGDTETSKALFWPWLWYMVVSSHPIGYWFLEWGIPLPGGSGDPTEGSSVDRNFFAGLTVIGFYVLARRRFSWGGAFRNNPWLVLFFAYMAASILWSDYSFVSFKRYIKVIGSIVMALVVLTDERPLQATFTVLRRCLYIHLPMSIICTRYFREIGVSYTYSGEGQSWTGIATSKNTLGQVAMIGAIYFLWEVRRKWPQYKWRNLHVLYLLMAIYLLKGAGDSVSMTSVSVATLGTVVFLRIQALRDRPEKVRGFVKFVFAAIFALIALVSTHSIVNFSADSLFGSMITTFGRDITMTDRTYIWNDVYAAAARNPMFGVGYGGFWIGRLVNIGWASSYTWVLGQAHSGYVDTYLQLGYVGVVMLFIVIFVTIPRLLASFEENFDFACFRITILITIIYVNITESTYLRGDHQFWFIMMIVIWFVPASKPRLKTSPVDESTARA